MRPIVLAFAALLVLALAPAVAAGSVSTSMSGAQEVPPRATPATGSFFATINNVTGEICWQLDWTGLVAPATAAHIHQAPAGTNGGVVIPLSVAPATAGTTQACVIDADAINVDANPSAFYVNLHTSTYPGGEIRGQLSAYTPPPPVPELPALALVLAGLVGIAVVLHRRR